MMNYLLTALKISLVSMFFISTSFALPAEQKGKLPMGTYVKQQKVFIKKGYVIEKVSDSKVNIKRMGNTGITGSFDCTCNGNDGGCDVITTPTSVSCAKSTCSSSCYMITTIPGKVSGYLFKKE